MKDCPFQDGKDPARKDTEKKYKKTRVAPRDRWYHSARSAARIRRTCPSSPRNLPPVVSRLDKKSHDRQIFGCILFSHYFFLFFLVSFLCQKNRINELSWVFFLTPEVRTLELLKLILLLNREFPNQGHPKKMAQKGFPKKN